VGGIKTNLAFHRRVMKNASFIEGRYDTSFIEREKAELLAPLTVDESDESLDAVLAAVAIHAAQAALQPLATESAAAERSAWQRGGGNA
jgi:acetyl/propionyl-CoA carboxylase alpha subunit